MDRVPYSTLAPLIDSLYAKEFAPNANEAIESHLREIVETLHMLGWTEEEYLRAFIGEIGRESGDLTSEPAALHCQNKQPN